MRKWLPLVLIAGVSALTAGVFASLPDAVPFPARDLFPFGPGAAEDMLPRAAVAFGLPLLALGVWALLHEAPAGPLGRAMARLRVSVPATLANPASFARYAPTYRLVVLWVVALILAFHLALLSSALDWPVAPGRIVGAVFGAGLILVGNVLPRLRPNTIAGLRTARTLGDPAVWARVHRRYGILWLMSGGIVLVTTIAAPEYALLVGLLALLLSSIAAVIGERSARILASVILAAVLTLSPAAAGSQPPASPALGAVPGPGPRDTLPPATVRESVVPLEIDGLAIHALLTMPAAHDTAGAPIPVALIVAGSGPTDHQGNSLAAPVRPFLYARLAWGLAERGIASVRYDKRGIGGSAGRGGDPATLTLGRYRDDVVALAHQLRKDPRFGRFVLIGHSEGAGLVLEAANAGAPADGFVMMSGAGRPLIELLADQFRVQFDSTESARLLDAFRAFLDGAPPADVPANVKPIFMPAYRTMLRSMASYDPAAELRRSRTPALVVHGRMDLQVTDADFDALVRARPAVDRLAIAGANHVYKAVTARTIAAQMPAYMNPTLELVPELVPAVAGWIHGLGPARP